MKRTIAYAVLIFASMLGAVQNANAQGSITLTPTGGPYQVNTNPFLYNATISYPNSSAILACNTEITAAPAGSILYQFQSSFDGENGSSINAISTGTPDKVGTYTLLVNCVPNDGFPGPQATITFTAVAAGTAQLPTITASITSTPPYRVGYPVFILTKQTAYNSASIVRVDGVFTSRPAGSTVSNISGTGNIVIGQTSWQRNFDIPGTYTMNWTATDSFGQVSAPAALTIVVGPAGPTITASVGSGPFNVGQNVPIQLFTSAPQGPISQITAVIKGKPTGSAVADQVLSGSATELDIMPDVGGNYSIELSCTDSVGNTCPAFGVSFTANSSNAPIIQNVTAQELTVLAGGDETLSALVTPGNVTDPVRSVTWIEHSPDGSQRTLGTNGTLPNSVSVFTPSLPGIYTIEVDAASNTGKVGSGSVNVTAIQLGSLSASANPAQQSTPVTFTLPSTGGDPSPLSVNWTITDASGVEVDASQIQTSANPIQATWTPPCGGTYTVQVTVSDGIPGCSLGGGCPHTDTKSLSLNVLPSGAFTGFRRQSPRQGI